MSYEGGVEYFSFSIHYGRVYWSPRRPIVPKKRLVSRCAETSAVVESTHRQYKRWREWR